MRGKKEAVSTPDAACRHGRYAAFLLAGCLACSNALSQSGVASGEARPPILDALNRPITAGGFVDGAPWVFRDVTAGSRLDQFRHVSGSHAKRYILEVPSGGVALFDHDRDGWLDVFFVNGSTFEALKGQEPHPSAALFRNRGDGTFANVTATAGVSNHAWGFGASVGDFDNDGWPDLYVANFGRDRLYRNNGDGTFTDVAEKAGLTKEAWTAGATFGDYNRDGHLDLFVAGYLEFDPAAPPDPGGKLNASYCQYRGKPVMCGPRGLKGTRDFLYLNKGDGTFTETAERAGVHDPSGYYGFGAAFVDVDQDAWLDLVVANDSVPNYLYRNKKDGTFEDISYMSGFAFNELGEPQAGMGLAIGDYNNDGSVDFYVTHFSDDYNTLYQNYGDGFFMDLTYQTGLAEFSLPFLGWGAGFLDFDNDGFKDLLVANGHVYPQVDGYNWGTTWAQRPLLFRNVGGKRFEVIPAAPDDGLAVVVPARGAAFGDVDNDGRVDVVLNCSGQSPRLLKNVTATGNHWISVQLLGKAPRDAVGATVFVTAGGRRQRADVISGGGYVSQSDLRLHFGLGSAPQVEKIEIIWPDGSRHVRTDLPVDRIVKIEQEDGSP